MLWGGGDSYGTPYVTKIKQVLRNLEKSSKTCTLLYVALRIRCYKDVRCVNVSVWGRLASF